MTEEQSILIAEDDEADVLLLKRAFQEVELRQPVDFVHDGFEAIEFLGRRRSAPNDRYPSLVILDLKMPRRSGLEVLQWMRQEPVLRCLPAIIFSSSARREEIERAYAIGANSFLVKPASTVQRTELARFIKAWLLFSQAPLASTEGFRSAHSAHLGGMILPPPAPHG